jgi:hypothetical protein
MQCPDDDDQTQIGSFPAVRDWEKRVKTAVTARPAPARHARRRLSWWFRRLAHGAAR